jgi:hypothetical protein
VDPPRDDAGDAPLRAPDVSECGALGFAFVALKRPASEWIRRETTRETPRCARRT